MCPGWNRALHMSCLQDKIQMFNLSGNFSLPGTSLACFSSGLPNQTGSDEPWVWHKGRRRRGGAVSTLGWMGARFTCPGSVCVAIQDCSVLHLLCLPCYPAWASFVVAAVPFPPAPSALLLVRCALGRGCRVACPKVEQGDFACPLQCPHHLSWWPRWICGWASERRASFYCWLNEFGDSSQFLNAEKYVSIRQGQTLT